MKTMSYTESRARYAEVLDGVVNDREEVVITRAGHDPVVIVSLDDYESLRETAYLMRSPRNARRLLDELDGIDTSPGGAGCVNGTRLLEDRAPIAAALGFRSVIPHTRDAMWQVDGLVHILATTASLLSNFSNSRLYRRRPSAVCRRIRSRIACRWACSRERTTPERASSIAGVITSRHGSRP